ncbi:6-carboxy-5,6,7,8-tetrahydropterin synthase [hydrothermal vent metagenome]|uniref:6-carboxy-5,6,7,8-tetrahydropterin synthase n=1 Tax=hydrothermal vent metagenome TaxID=652676 RepID=A0A3B0T3Y6_9ZZZZ
MSFEISFTRRYCMSHRLFNIKNSRCFIPHGHNEYVKVHLISQSHDMLDGAVNMIAPFAILKKRWHQWIDDHVDHSLQLSSQDQMLDYFKTTEPENLAHIMVMPGDPTTEVLAACFMSKINALLFDQGITVHCRKIEIIETPTNSVSFTGDPAQAICTDHYDGPEIPWWQRPDMSINDLDLP